VRGQTKKGEDIMYDLDSKINFAVFPGLQVCVQAARALNLLRPARHSPFSVVAIGRDAQSPLAGMRTRLCGCLSDVRSLLQGGPHNHTISGLACALKQATTPEFKEYQEQARPPTVTDPQRPSACRLLQAVASYADVPSIYANADRFFVNVACASAAGAAQLQGDG
jgi:Serine hydroxymethyltransferase